MVHENPPYCIAPDTPAIINTIPKAFHRILFLFFDLDLILKNGPKVETVNRGTDSAPAPRSVQSGCARRIVPLTAIFASLSRLPSTSRFIGAIAMSHVVDCILSTLHPQPFPSCPSPAGQRRPPVFWYRRSTRPPGAWRDCRVIHRALHMCPCSFDSTSVDIYLKSQDRWLSRAPKPPPSFRSQTTGLRPDISCRISTTTAANSGR